MTVAGGPDGPTSPPGADLLPPDSADELAVRVVRGLVARGETLGVAESLTGGALASALVGVPGASAAFRGGVVAYASDVKASLLGVPAGLLREHGAVHPAVAAAMAAGAAQALGAAWGVATTGVAGPSPQDGRPVGEVHVAVSGPDGGGGASRVRTLLLPGDRAAVREGAVRAALDLLLGGLGGLGVPAGR